MINCMRCDKPVTPDLGDGFNRCKSCWEVEGSVLDNFYAASKIFSDVKIAYEVYDEMCKDGWKWTKDRTGKVTVEVGDKEEVY